MKPLRRLHPVSGLFALTSLLWGCGGDSGTAPPEPDAPAPTTVSVNPDRASVDAIGATIQFAATVRDQLGREMPNAPVTWYYSDEAVATVSAGGLPRLWETAPPPSWPLHRPPLLDGPR